MEDQSLKKDLNQARKKMKPPFWGAAIAIVSILQGEFIMRVDGYLLEHSEPYLQNLPEELIGLILVIFGAVKLIGLISRNNRIKKYGILGLSSVWTGLFIISFTYSFGTGFPHPSWILYGLAVAVCYRVSLKGDFDY